MVPAQVEGVLHTFLLEPFVPHAQEDEYYVAITSDRGGEELLFCVEGGVDVGDVDAKASRMRVALNEDVDAAAIERSLLAKAPAGRRGRLAAFYAALLKFYRELHFTLLEINPLVVEASGAVVPLDLAAKIDETAHFLCQSKWGPVDLPAPFGRAEFPEEASSPPRGHVSDESRRRRGRGRG